MAIDRQRAALDTVRYRRAIRSDLGDLLVTPGACEVPTLDRPTTLFQQRIDVSKLDAVSAALGTKDFLIVEGPPGTGKTTFISELILQLLSKDPTQRILLTSQTHVALDNALENLLGFSGDYRIVRVGRSDNAKISSTLNELLLENQMDLWRTQVLAKGLQFLSEFAQEHGISSDQVRLGMSFERLSQIQREIAVLEEQIAGIQAELKGLSARPSIGETKPKDQSASNPVLDRHRVLEDELAKLRTELRLKSSERVDTRSEITASEPDAAELLELLRSAQIVAGTCVGIASVKGLQDLDFDTCIVDEASKATPTELLVPLSFTDLRSRDALPNRSARIPAGIARSFDFMSSRPDGVSWPGTTDPGASFSRPTA